MSTLMPLTWRTGVDNLFGWIVHPDGRRELAEPRFFIGRDLIACLLTDGNPIRRPADGTLHFQAIPAAHACATVGIPAPETDGASELTRRCDPFHVERHRSGLWNAIVEIAYRYRLPCGFSLEAFRRGTWDGTFNNAAMENPEVLAQRACLRFTDGALPDQAVRDTIATDAALPAGHELDELLAGTGWAQALPDLTALAVAHQERLDTAAAERLADLAADEQLSLL